MTRLYCLLAFFPKLFNTNVIDKYAHFLYISPILTPQPSIGAGSHAVWYMIEAGCQASCSLAPDETSCDASDETQAETPVHIQLEAGSHAAMSMVSDRL